MANDKICIGIDLGTTNSVIAWGRVGSENDPLEPQIIDVRMRNKNRALIFDPLLPSCVYFPKGQDYQIVGEYSKEFIDPEDVQRTRKSFKIKMGENFGDPIDDYPYSAAELSTMVLKHLKESAEKTHFHNKPFPVDVAIAVPASFKPEMRKATESAALEAGFKNPKLVAEPVAAFWDFKNWIDRGFMPPDQFNFNKPRLTLVFDLGGGTLDVTLYEVCFLEGQPNLDIGEIAVSRFTDIGGDNFDEKLKNFLLEKYQENSSSENEKRENRFRLYAEQAKIRLSTKLELLQRLGDNSKPINLMQEKVTIDTRPSESQSFKYDLSLHEYEECIKELLAPSLTLDSIDQYDPSETNKNIIDPIFDVLKKSEKRLGYIPKPEIVLLNGSMARLYSIQNRLKSFFKDSTIADIHDPEYAIARGAVAWLANEL